MTKRRRAAKLGIYLLIQKKRQIQKKVNEEILETNRNAILISEQRKAKELEE